ncbi:alpha/beta hydrolase [Piscinibacter gummiphilus]|uniref:Alpha/beta hydrolase n=1 Tax=Piscinibacter gummiphilus TaxID=946333 RepID=A0ABZ0CUP8_9BURK|nr:alpha/beta hydrolase [Piscinibacter gummiphilus]WOB06675.1 alpha/beta hydrolase [Piscinibacter gummiphilus]
MRNLTVAAALFFTGVLAAAQTASTAPCVEPVPPPASGAAPVLPPPRLQQLQYKCLKLNGGQRVLTGEAGDAKAPPVLLVHGLGNNAHRDWAPVIRPLAAQFHVITVDLPGFGASPGNGEGYSFVALGRVLSQVLEQLAPGQKAHVVGHSLGGAVSLFFAHAYGAQVERLVLVDAAGILLKTVYVQHMANLRTPQVGIAPVDRILSGVSDRLRGIKRGVFGNLDDRFDFSRWLAQNPGIRFALLGRYTQVEAGLGLVEHDFTRAIRETTAPTTVIWGADDPIAPLRTGRLLAARLPDARLKVIDGVGHTPMLESPEAFRALLVEALTAPLAPKYSVTVPEISQGDVTCSADANRSYTGRFDTLTLDNCLGVRVHSARIKRLVLRGSTVTIDDTVVEADDVALAATDSEVTATNLRLAGRVAVRAENSRIDLAGASLVARDMAVEAPPPSRVYFSVSEMRGRENTGDVHTVWSQTPAIAK